MKIGRIIYKFIVLFSLLLLLGCRPATVSNEKSQNKENKSEKDQFDPLELPSDTLIIPKINPQKGDLTGTVVKTEDQKINEQDSLANILIESIDTLNSQSFRVQLFSSKVYGTSKHTIRVAEEIFDRPVYLDYEVPYYKIRVGNFPNREEAEKYLLKVRTAGYNDAWVVAVNINVKESERNYQDSLLQMEPE
jgi:hypothetical protein